jgi:hypothetical protein
MYMIRLRKLLQEIQYGELLWAARRHDIRYNRFITRVYDGAKEADTEEEAELWWQLYTYLTNGAKAQLDISAIEQLLPLKQKFPAVLDPGLADSDMVYRGMTLAVEQCAELIQDPAIRITEVSAGDWFLLDHVSQRIESRSPGFVSVSLDWLVAANFALNRNPGGRWPIVVAIPYKQVKPSALMNPDFLTAAGGYQEKETWILDQSLPVTRIHVQTPWKNGTRYLRVQSRESALIADAIASRGLGGAYQPQR